MATTELVPVKPPTAAGFQLGPDDVDVLDASEGLTIKTADDYAVGFELLGALTDLEKAILKHYKEIKDPLNTLRAKVLEMEKRDAGPVTLRKNTLAVALGAWKSAEDDRIALEAARAQAEADAAALALHAAQAAAINRVADVEPDPVLADSLRAQAEDVRTAPITAKPAPPASTVPKVAGSVPVTWSAEVFDLKLLIKAWLDGKCHLDEAKLAEAALAAIGPQASHLRDRLADAYPGCRAVKSSKARAGRR